MRLLLVRHAPTPATRRADFPLDEPLDARGQEQAANLAEAIPTRAEVVSSPARRCRETAAAAGLRPDIDERLAECDFGAWAGRSLQQIYDEDSAAATQWMTDPEAAPHGGESLATFSARVAGWLDEERCSGNGYRVAITHGGVVKASVVHVLGARLAAFWRIDVSPLSITELHAHGDNWTLARVNAPVLR